jgi:hypothetical protein
VPRQEAVSRSGGTASLIDVCGNDRIDHRIELPDPL